MRIEYDKDVDVAYIYFKDITEGEVVNSISLNDSVNVDLDSEGRAVGVEVLDASSNLPEESLKSAVLVS